MKEFFYDFNRKKDTTREEIGYVYGADIKDYVVDRLAEINIYPMVFPDDPEGYERSAYLSAEEVKNGGPVFVLQGGKAVRKFNYVPKDTTKYQKLWHLLMPSQSWAKIQELASLDLTDNLATTVLSSLILAGNTLDSRILDEQTIKDKLQYFVPKLNEIELTELEHILGECELSYLLVVE